MPRLHIVIVVLGIALMLWLNMTFKLNAMLALLLGALSIGIVEMVGVAASVIPAGKKPVTLLSILNSITSGFGSTLGGSRGTDLWATPNSLAIIVVFGAIIGKLMVDSGAAFQIADTLIERFGIRFVKIALVLTGLVFGLAVFYEVAFIIMAPLIVAVAHEAKVPFMRLAIPAVAATTTAHSLFPPQAGPVALLTQYRADTGWVYIFALIVAIPTVWITGWILPKFLGNLGYPTPSLLTSNEDIPREDRPGFGISLLVPLIPAIIMIAATIANVWVKPAKYDKAIEPPLAFQIVNFIGSPVVAMSIAMAVAFFAIGTRQGRGFDWVMQTMENAVKQIAMVVLIIGAGGALKQIILDTGVGDYIGSLMKLGGGAPNPLLAYFMAWLITVLIRLATGQGVVSAMTAAGIIGSAVIDPASGAMMADVNPALLVVVTAAGPNTLTHINDASFWLFKGYFDLSVKDTLKTWGLLELCNSLIGLVACLGLGAVLMAF